MKMLKWPLSLFTVLFVATYGQAQTVRGTVTDRASGQPVAGAVVILEQFAADSSVVDSRTILAGRDGIYSVRAAGAGPARVIVRRIGAVPFRSEPFLLADGETRVVDVQMDRVVLTGLRTASQLGRVHVRQGTPCRATEDGERIATLWDDARTALMSTEVAAREGNPSRRLVRYVRELDIPSLKVFAESLYAFDGTDTQGDAAFRSLPGESLSREGYWHTDRNGAVNFYGPDARALLSESFVRDHCFRLADAVESDAGMVGLTFEPVPARTREYSPSDIFGVVRIDAATSELRQVEFDWTKLHVDTSLVGGEVRFTHDSTGRWYVSSWRLRMPREVRLVSGRGVIGRRQTLIEEGGVVLDDLPVSGFVPGTITGVVRDAKGKGLTEATVRVIGTDVRASTDQQGRYVLTGVPPGLHFVVAAHTSYGELGTRVGQQQVLITEGVVRELSFAAPSQERIGSMLCGTQQRPANTAILRVTLVDSMGDTPVSQVRVRLAPASSRGSTYAATILTDAGGSAVFCDAPAGADLILSDSRQPGAVLATVRLRRSEVAGRLVRGTR